MAFTPAPTKTVNFLDKGGAVIKSVKMNRAERRRLGLKGKGVKHGN